MISFFSLAEVVLMSLFFIYFCVVIFMILMDMSNYLRKILSLCAASYLICPTLFSQSEVVAGGGDVKAEGIGGLSASVGQMTLLSIESSSGGVAEGLQHPVGTDDGNLTRLTSSSSLALSVNVAPNPVSDVCVVSLPNDAGQHRFSLTDGSGKLMEEGVLSDGTKLSMSDYIDGSYFLKIYFGTGAQDFITVKLLKK